MINKTWDLGSIDIANFQLDRPVPVEPKLATKMGSELLINVGPRAANRGEGFTDKQKKKLDLNDGNDKVTIKSGIKATQIV